MNDHPIHRPSLRNLIGKNSLVGAEIGVGEGTNSLNILENLDILKLYLIDPYEQHGRGHVRFDRKAHNKKSQSMIGLGRVLKNLKPFEGVII